MTEGTGHPGAIDHLASSALSDACDELGVRAVRTGALRPSWPGAPGLTGPVATLTLAPASDPGADPLPALLQALAAMRGRVVLVSLLGLGGLQCWGGVLAVAAQRFGVLGALVDGGVRDLATLEEIGFPAYSRGVHPARVGGRLELASVDADVALGDGTVRPGDVVVADRDGAVFTPGGSFEELVELARAREAAEASRLALVRAGADPRDVFGAS